MTSATIPTELVGRALSLWQRALLYAFVTVLLGLALWVSAAHPYTPGSRLGYDLGLVGGLMMLALLLYPLRKHWDRMHNFGSLRAWFAVHLVFGIGGPLLVLFHTCFHLHSFNASVAFWCMVVVALSGGMGRYIYLHVYSQLARVQTRLWEIEGVMEAHGGATINPFELAPQVKDWLEEYRRHPLARRSGPFEKLQRVFARADRGRRKSRPARRHLAAALERHAKRERWSAQKLAGEQQAINAMIIEYVLAVDAAVRLTFWERAFSRWHLAHGPVVYLLVLSAVAHVVAVHAY